MPATEYVTTAGLPLASLYVIKKQKKRKINK